MSMHSIVHPVGDVAAATARFTTLLGVAPHTESAWYVGFAADGIEVGLDPHGQRNGLTGPVAYWHSTDIAATVAAMVEAGCTVHQEPVDVGAGTLMARVVDPDGAVIGLVQR